MVELVTGNLLQADAEALVNTVNTVGAMGKGIALQFKQAYPANFAAYQKAVARGEVQPGRMFVFETGLMMNPKLIINFPTKRHWRGGSLIEDIDAGLQDLARVIAAREIRSIAIPPLGCGNGGLQWESVQPRILAMLATLPDVGGLVFSPAGSPDPKRGDWATIRR